MDILGYKIAVPLLPNVVFDLFEATYAPDGSNLKTAQEDTCMNFYFFLEACELYNHFYE